MNTLKQIVFLCSFCALLVLGACSNDDDGGDSNPDPIVTNANTIATTWTVSKVVEDGFEIPLIAFSSFSVTFDIDTLLGQPTDYTVVTGNAPYTPNYNSPNTGTWAFDNLANPTQIVLGTGDNVSTLAIIGDLTETAITVEWTQPDDVDKTTPTISFELIAQ
ncbi:MAG: hypothetical protein KI790_03540 [Cyclobacteriaceae bacterium]|nr:hypothetical protein [Cyclobacteriaceae bacterium HetDA_MAG_MS6]